MQKKKKLYISCSIYVIIIQLPVCHITDVKNLDRKVVAWLSDQAIARDLPVCLSCKPGYTMDIFHSLYISQYQVAFQF